MSFRIIAHTPVGKFSSGVFKEESRDEVLDLLGTENLAYMWITARGRKWIIKKNALNASTFEIRNTFWTRVFNKIPIIS